MRRITHRERNALMSNGQSGYQKDDERRLFLEFQGEEQRQKSYTKNDEKALQQEIDRKSGDEKSGNEKK